MPYLKNGKYCCMVSCERYRIVYQTEENAVFVENIQDYRQPDCKNLI